MGIYRYRIKQVDDLCHPNKCYIAQFRYIFIPFFWFDIKPRGLGCNYGQNQKGAEIYINHHKGLA